MRCVAAGLAGGAMQLPKLVVIVLQSWVMLTEVQASQKAAMCPQELLAVIMDMLATHVQRHITTGGTGLTSAHTHLPQHLLDGCLSTISVHISGDT